MGIIGWIVYIFLGIVLFFLLEFIKGRYDITKLEKLVFSLIYIIVVSGIFLRIGVPYVDDIFLFLIFLMVTDILYQSYYLNSDFFDRKEKKIKYYILLVICGLIINYEFIDSVSEVFLTGEDYRIIIWFLIFIFLYKFFNDKKILTNKVSKTNYISQESVLVNYARLKFKYSDDISFESEDISKLVYSIMIFENSKRSKLLRKFDNFMFRINGTPRKLGIMQVESKKFITDIESIDIVNKKVTKLFGKTSTKKKNVSDVIESYSKENADYINYIFDIIKKI